MKLSNCTLVYEVTSLPHILFAQVVKGNEVLKFKDFVLPKSNVNGLVEIRISLYDSEGFLVEMSSQMIPPHVQTVVTCLNVNALKVVANFIESHKDS